jgi:hypothetical protein
VILISPKSKIARNVAAGAILLGLILSAVGCGGGGDRSARAVKWEVSRQLGPRQVRLVATVGSCGGQLPTIEPPVIEYSGNKVFIELLLAPEEESGDGDCLLELLGVPKVVRLKHDLDELVLLDSSARPPEPRWPE